MDETMDNQQETKSFMCGWLAAAIEGEGTIGIHNGAGKGHDLNYKPVIKVFNTAYPFIERTHKFLLAMDIPCHLRKFTPKNKSLQKQYRTCYAIDIQGFKRCAKALPILLPFFCSKKLQAEILLKIINSRLATKMNFGNQERGYTEQELTWIAEMKELNRRGKDSRPLNDYTRDGLAA
jgi:hypothetical protein